MSSSSNKLVKLDTQKRAERGGRGSGNHVPAEAGECPVTALGHRAGRLYFFDPHGQFVVLPARQAAQWDAQVVLFGRQRDWCKARFPQRDENGVVTGFNSRAVYSFLVDECGDAGLFDTRQPMHGVGVWRAGGGLLVHLGNTVLALPSGEARRAGFRAHGALWPAESTSGIVPPDLAGTSGDTAREVEAMFGRWSWAADPGKPEQKAGAAAAFMGLWAVGLLGGGAPWRPHGLVVGQPGWGKTSLFQFYRAISPLAEELNDFTEAGLRETFNGRTAPMVLDEAEADEQAAARMEAVIGMIRKMSSKEGFKGVRGGFDGGRTFSLNSMAMLGAVLPPPLQPQDLGRFTRLDIASPPKDGPDLPSDAEIDEWRELAPALWGRALAGIDRFLANLAAFKAELRRRGCSRRHADQMGSILAARAMMLVDNPLDPRAIVEHTNLVDHLIRREADEGSDGGPQQCFQHLLGCATDAQISNTRQTVGRLVVKARDDKEREFALASLLDHGLWFGRYPLRGESQGEFLYVSNSHPALRRFFQGLRWAGGRWREDLRHLPGALEPANPVRMGASGKPRVVLIPAGALPRDRSVGGDDEDGTNGTENGTEFDL